MSNFKRSAPLKHGEIQKHIIAKTQKLRSPLELFDQCGNYRDQNVSDYQKKKREFLEVCKQYNRLNQETLASSKKRLNSDYEELLDLSFLNEKVGVDAEVKDDKEAEKSDTCILEPWFKRQIILNKFIWAARTTILKLRLLKVLEKLKTLTPEKISNVEAERDVTKICELYHCDPVFAKFL